MSVEIQRKLAEILKKRQRDESDFPLKIVVHPTVLERLRTSGARVVDIARDHACPGAGLAGQ